MDKGKIVLPKSFLEWEWISSPEAVSLYMFLLLRAPRKDTVMFGEQVHRGQVLAMRSSLVEHLGISPQRMTTAMKRLVKSKLITIDKVRQYYLITLTKFDEYALDTASQVPQKI